MTCDTCKRSMEGEGRDLDIIVAEQVFGLETSPPRAISGDPYEGGAVTITGWQIRPPGEYPLTQMPHYSTTWQGAGLVLEEMRGRFFSTRFRFKEAIGAQMKIPRSDSESIESARLHPAEWLLSVKPHHIARAALLATCKECAP